MRYRLLIPIIAAACVFSCASTPTEAVATESTSTATASKPSSNLTVASGTVTIEQPLTALVDIARIFGQQEAGGIVLMNGLGFETAGPFSWKNRPFPDAVRDFATAAEIELNLDGPYAFLYPAGYEVLNGWEMPAIPGAADLSTGVALGHGTKLSSAVAFVSHITGVTVLVDNAVADARTAEMWLPTLPLGTVLEAMMKGARVPPEGVRVTTADRMVLVQAGGNRSNPGRIGPEAPELQTRATVYLPAAPANPEQFEMHFEARELGELLPVLSAQMGVPVEIAPGLERLPVEQCAFIDQPREAILKGLIAQWPAPGIGYRWTGSGMVIERAGSTAPLP